ncbi:histone-lysine N-methyltransferase PRDM9-like isoform X2 [Macrobrachium nipponense]|uniref:histone-lysine N-methyltransferase PRDM9-like isoform X2 n=1 Tax=Macrobrachium nipponense TaxID=159736 RepID=UPI0030C8612C
MSNILNVREVGTSTRPSLQSSSLFKVKNNRRCAIRMGFNKLPSSRCRTVLNAIQEKPTLSIGQRDVAHLWTTAKLEYVPKGFVKVVPLPPVTSVMNTDKSQEVESQPLHLGKENIRPGVRKNPRRKASLLVRSYKEADIREDDYIYCDECMENREGECPFHPFYLILDVVVPRDGSVKDRARQTVPWPLAICQSKVKGAGLGVWTNESLPAHLLFGPYEGHFLPSVEPGEESGYGWLVRWKSSSSACIDAYDESVSNWMRFVNCSRNDSETNIGAFQYKGLIYYKTLKEIKRGTELMVWYGEEYGKELGLSRLETSRRAQHDDYEVWNFENFNRTYLLHRIIINPMQRETNHCNKQTVRAEKLGRT